MSTEIDLERDSHSARSLVVSISRIRKVSLPLVDCENKLKEVDVGEYHRSNAPNGVRAHHRSKPRSSGCTSRG